MHKDELTEAERQSFDRAMDTVRELPESERLALLEHAVAATIRYTTTTGRDQVLNDWAHGLLTTLRTARSKAYQAAVAGHRPPDLRRAGMSAKELLSSLGQ